MHRILRTGWIWIVGIILLLLIAAGTAGHFLIPGVDQQLRSAQDSFLRAAITLPTDGSQIPAGERLSILVQVDAQAGISAVELFIDGRWYPDAAAASPLDKGYATLLWIWVPEETGMVRLVAKVLDGAGQTAWSDPVRVFVTEPAARLEEEGEVIPTASLPAFPDQLLDVLLDPEVDEETLNALLDSLPEGVIGGGPLPSLPASLPVVPPAGEEGPIAGEGSSGSAPYLRFRLWMQGLLGRAQLPAAPGLRAEPDGCSTRLLIQDFSNNEAGFRLFHLGPYDTDFQPIARFPAGEGDFVYIDTNLPAGNHQYYLTALNGGGETAGELAGLDISDPACQSNAPSAISFATLKVTPSLPVDRLYCYLSLDEVAWTRIPADDGEFVLPEEGAFDLAPHARQAIPSLSMEDEVILDCWGWQGENLLDLGRVIHDPLSPSMQTVGADFGLQVEKNYVPLVPGFSVLPVNYIAPPYLLHYPSDMQDCLEHEVSLACAAYEEDNPHGFVVLAWSWRPEGDCEVEQNCGYNVNDIDGFHVYQVSPVTGEALLIQTVPADSRLAVVDPPTIGVAFLHPQYVVRAYRGVEESTDSNLLTSNKGQYTLTIPATVHPYTVVLVHKYRMPYSEKWIGPVVAYDLTGPGFPESEVGTIVGYMATSKAAIGWDGALWYKDVSLLFDKFFAFDLTNIEGGVISARLRWEAGLASFGEGDSIAEPYHCGDYIDANTDTLVQGYPLGVSGDLDVTDWVRAWLDGLEVYGFDTILPDGFWFRSGIRNLPFAADPGLWGTSADYCSMSFYNVRLYVEYEGE